MFSEKSSISCRLIIPNFSDRITSLISSSFVARPRQIFQDATIMLLFCFKIFVCRVDLVLLEGFCFTGEFVCISLALLHNLKNGLEMLVLGLDKIGKFVGLVLCSERYAFAFEILCCLFRF